MKKLWMIGVCLGMPGLTFAQNLDLSTLADLTKGPKMGYHFPCAEKMLCQDEIKFYNDFEFYGYIDASYNHLLSNEFTSGVQSRVFDLEPNGFTLQAVSLTAARLPEHGFGGLATILIGRDANSTAAYGWNPDFGSQTLAIDPLEVYLQYSWDKFSLAGGKFASIMDVEDFDNTNNTNFSRSILFGYATPGTLLGLRGTYLINNRWDVIVGVNNGWDTIRDFSRTPTFELATDYKVTPKFNLSAVVYTGEERLEENISTGPKSWRSLVNVFGTYNVTERLALVLNTMYGWQDKATIPGVDAEGDIIDTEGRATWGGLGGYVIYSLTDQWKTTLRGEYFDDTDGFRTGVAQKWKELTFALSYSPIKCFELRAEVRRDFSNEHSFLNVRDNGTRNFNQSYGLEAIYKFGYPASS